jgi:hypothetical protein
MRLMQMKGRSDGDGGRRRKKEERCGRVGIYTKFSRYAKHTALKKPLTENNSQQNSPKPRPKIPTTSTIIITNYHQNISSVTTATCSSYHSIRKTPASSQPSENPYITLQHLPLKNVSRHPLLLLEPLRRRPSKAGDHRKMCRISRAMYRLPQPY